MEHIASNAAVDENSTEQAIVNATRSLDLTESRDFKTFLTHPVVIDYRVWNAASPYVLLTNDLISFWETTIALSPMASKYSNLMYSTSSIKIKVVVQGQAGLGGQIVMSFTPRCVVTEEATTVAITLIRNLVRAKIVPHIVIDPSQTATYELVLPICTPSGVWATKGVSQGSYAVSIYPYTPLFTGTAVAPVVSMTTYMSFEGGNFDGLTMLSNPFVEEKQGKLSSLMAKMSSISNFSGKLFPSLSPYTTLFSNVSTSIGGVLSSFGFAKPQQTRNEAFIGNRLCDNSSQFEGTSTAYVLAGTPANSVSLYPPFGPTSSDCMDLHTMCAVKGLVMQETIGLATATGDVFISIPITPTFAYSPNVGEFIPCPMGGAAMPFSYWSGDILVDIEILASVFHRGTLIFAWDPSFVAGIPTMYNALQVLQNVTVTVSGNTNVQIRIPWKQIKPWGKVSPQLTDSGIGFPDYYCNGKLIAYVLNPFTTNGSLDGISINVYYSSDNISFAVPQIKRLNSVQPEFEVLSAEFTKLEQVTKVSFGSKTDLTERTMYFGEKYSNVKDLTSKVVTYADTGLNIVANSQNLWAKVGIPAGICVKPDGAIVGSSKWANYAAWFAGAFYATKGSQRFAIMTVGDPLAEKANAVYSYYSDVLITPLSLTTATGSVFMETSSSFAYSYSQSAVAPNHEVVAPPLHPYNFWLAQNQYTHYRQMLYMLYNIEAQTVDMTARIVVSMGTGDDVTFSWFLGFPLVTYE